MKEVLFYSVISFESDFILGLKYCAIISGIVDLGDFMKEFYLTIMRSSLYLFIY